MAPEIIPILSTQIDWQMYLGAAKKGLNRNVAKELDKRKIPVDSLRAFLLSLGTFKDSETTLSEITSDSGLLLYHGFFGFLVIGSEQLFLEIAEETTLKILTTETKLKNIRLAVVSGLLNQWREAFINIGSDLSGFELRLFLNKCISYFETINLKIIWQGYYKAQLQDQTFELKHE